MSLERMHTMLKLMTSGRDSSRDIKFDMNFIELKGFLQVLVNQEKINCIDGEYTIHRT